MSRRSCGGPPGSLRSGRRTASPTSPTGCRSLLAAADHRRCTAATRRRRRPAPAAAREADPLDPPRFWQWSRYEPTPFANAAMRDGTWKLRYPAVPEVFDILADDPVEERRLLADPTNYRLPAGKLDRAHPSTGAAGGSAVRPLDRSRRAASISPPANRNASGGWRPGSPPGTTRSSSSGPRSGIEDAQLGGVMCDMVPSPPSHGRANDRHRPPVQRRTR